MHLGRGIWTDSIHPPPCISHSAKMATVVGGTHPTRMHSCLKQGFQNFRSFTARISSLREGNIFSLSYHMVGEWWWQVRWNVADKPIEKWAVELQLKGFLVNTTFGYKVTSINTQQL